MTLGTQTVGLGVKWGLRPASELGALRDEWDQLVDCNLGVPFLLVDFLLPALKHFGSGKERLALGRAGGRLIGGAIVRPVRLGVWESFQPSQLPLGPVIADRSLPIHELAAGILRALPVTTLQLGLTQLDPFMFDRPSDANDLQTLDYIETAWIDIEGDFASYWAGRGKNLRQNIAKQKRKLEAESLNEQVEELVLPEAVSDGLRDYSKLECAGWKAQEGTAIDLHTSQGRFYAEMMDRFAYRRMARVFRYCLNGKAAAVDLCIENGRTQVVLKTTYDESLKSLSPATLMRHDVLAKQWEGGRARRIEFYGKRMEWHQRWTDNSRSLYHLNALRWPAAVRLMRRRPFGATATSTQQ